MKRTSYWVGLSLMLAGTAGRADPALNLLMTLRGAEPNQHLPSSMAGVGDVNGDGLADFLVGDAFFRRCLLYLGKTNLDTVPDVTFALPETCQYPYHGFGVGTSGGHDVNGDGFDDLVITDTEWLLGTGKLFLYYGRSEIDTVPDIGLASVESSWLTLFWHKEIWGCLVHDMNGDGFAELAWRVWEPVDNGVYVYFGGAPMDSMHDLALRCMGEPGQMVGSSIASGDVNGDGFGDIVASLLLEGGEGAWVYFGSPSPDSIPDVRLELPGDCWRPVQSICCNLDGDDFDDIVLTCLSDTGQPHYLIYFGNTATSGAPDLWFAGSAASSAVSVAGGDLDGDGFDDLVAVEESHLSGTCVAMLRVYLGGMAVDTIPDLTHELVLAEDAGHLSVVWIGDATGDGYGEFALANPGLGGWARPEGEIYIYTMGPVSAVASEVVQALTLRIAPNPAAEYALVSFVLSSPQRVRLGAYDAGGRLRGLVSDGVFERGSHSVRWATSALSPGVYVIRLEMETGTVSRRVVVGR